MRRIIATFLTLLFLATNSGMVFASHECGGEIVKFSLEIGHAELSCGMTETTFDCENLSNQLQLQKKDCCNNRFTDLQIESEFKVRTQSTFNFIPFWISHPLNDPAVYEVISSGFAPQFDYYHYTPPLLNADIPVFIQTFLI